MAGLSINIMSRHSPLKSQYTSGHYLIESIGTWPNFKHSDWCVIYHGRDGVISCI